TSLGYFSNPLIKVLFCYLFLRERLSPMRFLAVMLAVAAVSLQIIMLGRVPWIAFSVAFSFGFYGLIRKMTNVNATPGLATETLLLLPIVVVYIIWLGANSQNHFVVSDLETSGLLFLAGVVTTVPLICFNIAAKKLSLTVLGILQYLGPSLSFLVGVFIYNEPLELPQMITFALIWTALAIFTMDGIRQQQKKMRNTRKSSLA
ncbi:MAG: EamA family transporter RarD, partial [Endozoicomonas sp.]